MNKKVINILKPLMGKKCCRIKIGSNKSLSLGFGEKIFHNNPRLNDNYYGEWEIGTYYCAWRIMKSSGIIYGYNDTVENITELNDLVNKIEFGRIISINQLTNVDVRINLDSEFVVDFMATISENDEYFHIFCPNKIYIALLNGGKWVIGRSDKPFLQ